MVGWCGPMVTKSKGYDPEGRTFLKHYQAMKIKLEHTEEIQEMNGLKCRIWKGTTEHGVPIEAYIPLITCERTAVNKAVLTKDLVLLNE
jgi:hypothetical protein